MYIYIYVYYIYMCVYILCVHVHCHLCVVKCKYYKSIKSHGLNLNDIRIHMHFLTRPMSIAKNRSSVRVVSCKLANCWVLSGHHDPIMLSCMLSSKAH